MRKLFLALLILVGAVHPAFAKVNVVATLPWIGSVVKEIGGDKIDVTTLVKSNQDPHMIEAKPSMLLAGRKADILMFNGLDLEIGYLPLIMEKAQNPAIVPGKPGNFDCSQYIAVLEKPLTPDRSMGDVHPLGNPHYHFSPINILHVARGMTSILAEIDEANADYYKANLKKFAARMDEHKQVWSAAPLNGKKFIAYHRLFEYLASDFGFKIIGYVEPKPGIPPSAAYVQKLAESMKTSKPDAIITTAYYGKHESEALAERTGSKIIALPHDVGSMPGTEDWFAFMDKVLSLLR
jgi:zinc/manganese transport system substrate-binding protein